MTVLLLLLWIVAIFIRDPATNDTTPISQPSSEMMFTAGMPALPATDTKEPENVQETDEKGEEVSV